VIDLVAWATTVESPPLPWAVPLWLSRSISGYENLNFSDGQGDL